MSNMFHLKFTMDRQAADSMMDKLTGMDRQQTRRIRTLLYDTSSDRHMRQGLADPDCRRRLLLTSDSTPNYHDEVFLQLEEEKRGTLDIRNTGIRLEDVYRFLGGEDFYLYKGMRREVLQAIEAHIGDTPVLPRAYLSYDRVSFIGCGVEFHFDSGLRSRRVNLQLEAGDYGDPLVGGDTSLAELRWTGQLPFPVAELLRLFSVAPIRDCRYEAEYLRSLGAAVRQVHSAATAPAGKTVSSY